MSENTNASTQEQQEPQVKTSAKTIRDAVHMSVAGVKINGQQAEPVRTSLGALRVERRNGKDVRILALGEVVLPDEALSSDKITVELDVEAIHGPT